jgi:membrane protein YdbS with pleckstrin-like domain
MHYPEKLLSPGEEVITEFRPHWSAILREGLLTGLVLILVILIAFMDFSWRGWLILGLLVVAFLLVIRGFVRWWTTQHVITNERVIHRMGFISKKGTEIPLEVINDVSFRQSVFERIFGTGDVLIESAGTHGQSKYTDIPKPEHIQSVIYQARENRQMLLEGGGRMASAVGESTSSQLATLSQLHDDGKLTDAEFAAEKAKLLGGGA